MSVAERGPRKGKRPLAVGNRVKQLGRRKSGKLGTVVELIAPNPPTDPVVRAQVHWDGTSPVVQTWPVDFLVIVDDEPEPA